MKPHLTKIFLFTLCLSAPLLLSCGPPEAPESSTHTDDHGDEHAEGEGLEINLDEGFQLSAEQIERSAISATVAKGEILTKLLRLPATAEQNLDEQSHVNAPLPGVVVQIQAVLGAEVEVGDPMCTIRSAELAAAVADFHADQITLASALEMREREEELLDRGVALARDAVTREKSMSEQGFGTARLLANAQVDLQKSELNRDQRILELDRMVAKSKVAVFAAQERIASWGFGQDFLNSKEAASGLYTLYAQTPGVVLERHITLGETVQSQRQLFFVQGMEKIWMLGIVFENQLRLVEEGAQAIVRFHAFPEMEIKGEVDHIHHDLDESTRSVKARVKVSNRALAGRIDPHPFLPGMYGSIEVEIGKVFAEIAIPAASLLKEGEREFVFTLSESGIAHRKFVEVGLRTVNKVEILSGLEPGDLVVTEGMFTLNSLLHPESFGEHGH